MGLANIMTQVGAVSFLPCASTRRRIEPGDLRWAREKRAAGWGWQAIAGALRLNRQDLQMQVEGGGGCAKAKAPATLGVQRWTVPADAHIRLRILTAIANGRRRASTCGDAVGRAGFEVQSIVKDCKSDGLVTGDARKEGWTLTGRGMSWITARGATLA